MNRSNEDLPPGSMFLSAVPQMEPTMVFFPGLLFLN